MNPDDPVPRQVKAVDTASLLRLEERARELTLNQRLDPVWVEAHAAPGGTHFLWPAVWNSTPHRPDVPRQLRCELLLALRTGERVMSLLDVLPEEFDPLPRLTDRTVGLRVSRLLDSVPTVRQWLMRGESPEQAGRTS
ncbi:hypothetical protein [Streptomyces xanthophaeus]|uniref:hypothetical protein n=1 Tax=Streptomyces xanthophaeus TaxID=67385 RepID=UPI00369C97BB